MVLESLNLPGWELILFIALVFLFLIVGGVTAFIILSRLRWPFKYVILENSAGKGYTISRRGRCKLISLGDMGEEIFLLKHINKYRLASGERIGPKQVGWAVDSSGLWYAFNFGDLNKKLREVGVIPISRNVMLGMSAVRKNLDNRLGEKSFMEKYGPILYFGMFLMVLFLFAGLIWYTTNKQIEIANINSNNLELSQKTQEATQQTLASLDNILSRINLNVETPSNIISGSGLTSENG